MKTNLAVKFSLLAVLALAAAFFAGCSTTKPVAWDSRVGTYTFDQAVTELGPPDKPPAKLSDGKTVVQWVTHRSGGSGLGIGTGFYTGGVGVGVSQSVGSGRSDKILTLTFNTNNVLASWKKNY
jgi:outer membrane protein assembly factor BamE (lipoprotein component of BamABCDE complex)